MSSRRPLLRSRGLVASLSTGVGVALALSVSPAAGAAEANLAPVTADDTLQLTGTQQLGIFNADRAYVLLNDTDPERDPLEICSFTTTDRDAISVDIRVDRRTFEPEPYLSVQVLKNETASYTIPYQACDGQSQTPGTLTVEVTRIEPIVVTVSPRGRSLRISNPGSEDVEVSLGKPDRSTYNGVSESRSRRLLVSAGVTAIVRVKRDRIAYGATTVTGALAGSDIVRVRAPRG